MHKKCWLIQLFFRIKQWQQFFCCDLPIFPLILTEKLAAYPLIQPSFSYSFFYVAEIYKLEIFKNLPFVKNKYSRDTIFFLARKNKYFRKLVRLRYAMFLSELSPLSFPSSDNTLLG